ncbi:uncharacterized protein LOC108828393 isoform X2 [Raphanus sativus]|uniref:Uncharacterized protein LOC108828393 isoform X2 n=1 Tax=Raphanus sativus TaxID=3726 RepID=A0A9W3CD73_RAPSA|nr:uncharacterized protein LOC108828393 isoform X2 [Raphanus sativus]
MAASTLTLPCFKLYDQPTLLLRGNKSSNQTLLRFNLSPPKPLLISSRDNNSSQRFRALPETIAVKQDDTTVMALYVTPPKLKWKPLLSRWMGLSWRVGPFE